MSLRAGGVCGAIRDDDRRAALGVMSAVVVGRLLRGGRRPAPLLAARLSERGASRLRRDLPEHGRRHARFRRAQRAGACRVRAPYGPRCDVQGLSGHLRRVAVHEPIDCHSFLGVMEWLLLAFKVDSECPVQVGKTFAPDSSFDGHACDRTPPPAQLLERLHGYSSEDGHYGAPAFRCWRIDR